jgi:3-dehydroquinate synthase
LRRDLLIRFPASKPDSRIRVGAGALDRLGAFTRSVTGARRVALVSDVTVAALYQERAIVSLRRAGLEAAPIAVAPGERSKEPRTLVRLWRELAAVGLDRGDVVVALGGGVVGDLAGFAAATWLRGIPWIGVPTTLLAQVDSSIGGKTAIDLPAGKNLVGAFHQPAGVLVDPTLVMTLPARHVRAGLAEVVKMGMTVDASLFRWTEAQAASLVARDPATLAQCVSRSIEAKARVVRRDPLERPGGARTALNYGHTVGHALEAALGYRRLLHGEAVSLGMRVAAALSERYAGLAPSDRARQDALLDRFGLRRSFPPVAAEALLDAMSRDKKRRGGTVRWVLTPRMGHASVPRSIPGRVVEAALLEAGARSN